MTGIVAKRFEGIKPSPSMAAKARVDALRVSGHTIVDFTLGEPDFATPLHIVEAAIEGLAQGQTKYTSSLGTPALRSAIIGKLKRENNLTYGMDQVVVGCGTKHLIYSAFSVSLEQGDQPAHYTEYDLPEFDQSVCSGPGAQWIATVRARGRASIYSATRLNRKLAQ